MNNFTTSIDLSKEEALVLFDFLVRFNQKNLDDLFEDPAEQKALWALEAMLEKQLTETLQNDYNKKLYAARDIVRSNN